MKPSFQNKSQGLKPYSNLLVAALLAGFLIALPQAVSAAPPSAQEETTKPKKNTQSADKAGSSKKAEDKKGQDGDGDGKSKTESFQENLKTAKEAYEKVGAEILDGNYGKALDGATDMAKDKMIEKAEEALKKKNETLYKAYKHGKEIKDDLQKGDYQAAWDKTKDAAYDEAKEFVEDKLIEKVIPGYGQLKGAWDAGYATGELVGQIPISADGRTVNDLAEEQMRQKFFGGVDKKTSKKEAFNEVILALVKSVKSGEYKLPQYMTFSDAREMIQENMDGNRHPYEGFRAWAANELRDEDVTESEDRSSAVPPVAEKPALMPLDIGPAAQPIPLVQPEEDDPWGAAPAQEQQPIQEEIREQVPEPEEDIWASDDDGGSSFADEERYRLQLQLDADKARDRAIADQASYQKFAVAEAKREEKARIKAEKARKFREGMNALAQGLGQVAQQIQEANQGVPISSGAAGTATGNGKRQPTQAEKAAAIYRMCVQRTGDKKGCRSLSSTGAQMHTDVSKGKIPMDFIRKTCRQDSDSNQNYERCVADRVAEMKRRMGQ